MLSVAERSHAAFALALLLFCGCGGPIPDGRPARDASEQASFTTGASAGTSIDEDSQADTDHDSIPNGSDVCPLEREDKDGYLDLDGCPDLDNDGDGLPDRDDKCTVEPEDFDEFEDKDGCPDLDNDRDGIPDLEDKCPMEPGVRDSSQPGCPRMVVITGEPYAIIPPILFDHGKYKLKPEHLPILDNYVEVLRAHPTIRVEVIGHTDNSAVERQSKGLSERRAEEVTRYLISKGIEASRMNRCSHGDEQPLANNDTEKGRAMNRRVQIMKATDEPACRASTPGRDPKSPP